MTGPAPRLGLGRAGRGQATVELALGLPIIAVAVLLVLQLALVGRDALLVTHAAREAVRSAAVDPTADAAEAGARNSSRALDPTRLDVDVHRERGRVTVEVTYRAVTGLPLVGAVVPDPVLTASATMLEER